jgi:ParB-like chromosome segregation protein Spo0J
MEFKINPEFEKLIPAQDKATINEIFESIKATGVRDPIDVNSNGTILDGHTRFRICQKLGIKPPYRVMKFSNVFEEQAYVISTNRQRRQMNIIQKVELCLREKAILKQAAKQNLSLGGKGA